MAAGSANSTRPDVTRYSLPPKNNSPSSVTVRAPLAPGAASVPVSVTSPAIDSLSSLLSATRSSIVRTRRSRSTWSRMLRIEGVAGAVVEDPVADMAICRSDDRTMPGWTKMSPDNP